jgi:hypothetical protein
MAFAVYSAESHIPERTFAALESEAVIPAVCIEGIRVSNVMPGFERAGSLSALLSVRGSRNFRTTVSRDGLEIDEEYENVSKVLAEMFFGHIGEKVSRIAEKSGKPLSLASSAARWLFRRLESAGRSTQVLQLLDSLFSKMPSIVLERVESLKDRPRTTRSLMSAEQLCTLEFSVDNRFTVSRITRCDFA